MDCFEDAYLVRFGQIVAGRFGLRFGDGRQSILADALRTRLEARGCKRPADYLATLADNREELREVAPLVTVTETYFLRAREHFRVLAELATGERFRSRRLRVLSAGCASGEEPYSIAMALREWSGIDPAGVEILGLDLNPAAIAKARKGLYHEWSLRDTPGEFRERYFHRQGTGFALTEAARSMVSFEEQNLTRWSKVSQGSFDAAFCRNVLMYLTPAAAQALVANLTAALEPDGLLFLGSAETLRGLSLDFDLKHTHETFYYQKRRSGLAAAWACTNVSLVRPESKTAVLEPDWACAIRQATERIDGLSRAAIGTPEASTLEARHKADAQRGRRAGRNLGFAFELVRQERFPEALELVTAWTGDAGCDPEIQFLHASLLIHCGDLGRAATVCRTLLGDDNLNAGAHFLMALCSEHAGDVAGAIEHDRAAIYLDSAFAMPHLHLGRMAKRLSDLATARRELADAKLLLAREDPARIQLFGGGFDRKALIALSMAELEACGGK